MRDPNFFKTAVLIVEHGAEGAMGLIINRPSDRTVAEELNGQLDLPVSQQQVFLGGPVEEMALFVVHDCSQLDPDELPVIPGVYMGSNEEVFKDIVCGCGEESRPVTYRVYRGCSSWGPGQLEGELARGDWLVATGKHDYVFHSDPYTVWDELVGQCCQARRIVRNPCDHPEWN